MAAVAGRRGTVIGELIKVEPQDAASSPLAAALDDVPSSPLPAGLDDDTPMPLHDSPEHSQEEEEENGQGHVSDQENTGQGEDFTVDEPNNTEQNVDRSSPEICDRPSVPEPLLVRTPFDSGKKRKRSPRRSTASKRTPRSHTPRRSPRFTTPVTPKLLPEVRIQRLSDKDLTPFRRSASEGKAPVSSERLTSRKMWKSLKFKSPKKSPEKRHKASPQKSHTSPEKSPQKSHTSPETSTQKSPAEQSPVKSAHEKRCSPRLSARRRSAAEEYRRTGMAVEPGPAISSCPVPRKRKTVSRYREFINYFKFIYCYIQYLSLIYVCPLSRY